MRPGRMVTSPRSKTSEPGGIASPGPTAVIRSPSIRTTGFSTMRPATTSSIAFARTALRLAGAASGAAPPRIAATPTTRAARAVRPGTLTLLPQVLLHVFLRDHRRRKNDLLRHLLALEDLLGDVDGLLAARRIDERGRELAV